MTTYVLGPSYFSRLRRLTFAITVPLCAFAAAVALFSGPPPRSGSRTPALVGFAASIVVLIPTLWWSLRRQIARWRTFLLTVDGDQITRTQEGFDDVVVRASSIQRLVRMTGRGLRIYTDRSDPVLVVPDGLERFEEFCSLVRQYRPIESRAAPPLYLVIPLVAAFLVADLAFMRATDPRLVAAFGLVLCAIMVLAFWKMRTSPLVDRRTRRLSWLSLVLALQFLLRVLAAWRKLR